MKRDAELWNFIAERLKQGQLVMLLVVAESFGSSPGRAGYKMAVAAGGQLFGSIGGGLMEVNLVEHSRTVLSEPGAAATGVSLPRLIEQVHQKNSPHASGMICSGKQTVILVPLTPIDSQSINSIISAIRSPLQKSIQISRDGFTVMAYTDNGTVFNKKSNTEFIYSEPIGHKLELFIIGGGHCSLALSEIMSKLDFRITIFDDRPDLNTVEKNRFAHEIRIIESYENIGEFIRSGPDVYVVVMTVGYASDEIVIRGLADKDLQYFGVLGSKAKMAVLLKSLEKEGLSSDRLSRIRTPIGLPISSRTPEEIAVSIAAEIISVKNTSDL